MSIDRLEKLKFNPIEGSGSAQIYSPISGEKKEINFSEIIRTEEEMAILIQEVVGQERVERVPYIVEVVGEQAASWLAKLPLFSELCPIAPSPDIGHRLGMIERALRKASDGEPFSINIRSYGPPHLLDNP